MTQAQDTGLRDVREAPTLEPCPYCKSPTRMRRESGVTGKVCRSRYYRERVVCTNENCRAVGPMGKSPNSTVSKWNRVAATAAALAPSKALKQAREAPRPLSDWHEDDGDVLWWKFPIVELPYVGSPLADDWPGYHTHWTLIFLPDEPCAVLSSLPPSPETEGNNA